MSQTPVILILSTTEYRAALLLEVLAEKAKATPSGLPERDEWLHLARDVASGLADHLGHGEPKAINGRGV